MADDLYLVSFEPTIDGVGPDSYVTVAGTVRAPNGAAIIRDVEVFNDNDLTVHLGRTLSSVPYGDFSVDVPGGVGTLLTVICKGRLDENDVIYAHCKQE